MKIHVMWGILRLSLYGFKSCNLETEVWSVSRKELSVQNLTEIWGKIPF